ncbi:MAG: single-stranded DNA-binding protein [Thalassotalea sp.]
MSTALKKHHLCKVTLLGNLVSKPEIRYLANPVVAMAEVTLATHSRWFDKQSQQYKEWTHYHTVKVIGDIVDQTLLYAEKGEVMLVHGYLLNSKQTNREIIHANFAQVFAKGYAQSINLVQVSGELSAPIKLMTTEQDKLLGEGNLTIKHQVISPISGKLQEFTLTRAFHVWGKQAQYLHDHAKPGSQMVIEGKLSYMNNADKTQFIESQQTVLLAS